jgi:hypothetical protein
MEKRNAYRILVGRPERKRLLGRAGYSLEAKIKTVLRELVWGDLDWIHLAQDRDQ